MTFRNAIIFAETVLTSDKPGMLQLAGDVLDYYNNADWVSYQLKLLGITPDPENEMHEYVQTWENLRYRDLYKRLSRQARKRWRSSEMLMELLPL